MISNNNDCNQRKNSTDSEKSAHSKNKTIFKSVLRIVGLLFCLYFFIVSLGLMSSAFRLVAGKKASEFLSSKYVLSNPVTGLMIGIVITVLMQSSSTSSSIIVSMVGAKVMKVDQAIPVIMGANIGTSITSTLVSFGHVSDRENFKKAFAGATLHDCFNLLCVAVFLPLEVFTGYLEVTSEALVNAMIGLKNNTNIEEPQLLEAITKPLANLIIQLDSEVLSELATNQSTNKTLIKHLCKEIENGKEIPVRCTFLFESSTLPEWAIGLIVLIISIIALSSCLIGMVKILSAVFKGPVSKIVTNIVNNEPKNFLKYFTGLFAMIIGAFFTMVVQSSSVFTSTLIPMIGLGMVSLERVFPMVLGSNIGTTFTGILAAFGSSNLSISLQIALCHTLFNISGIIAWYPVPFLRRLPIKMAQFLGETSSVYRWFAIAYLIIVFCVIPIIVFILSLTGLIAFSIILGLILLIMLLIAVVNGLQKKKPSWLPEILKTWNFLPIYLRSLKPYDDILKKMKCANDKIQSVPIDQTHLNKEIRFLERSKLYYL